MIMPQALQTYIGYGNQVPSIMQANPAMGALQMVSSYVPQVLGTMPFMGLLQMPDMLSSISNYTNAYRNPYMFDDMPDKLDNYTYANGMPANVPRLFSSHTPYDPYMYDVPDKLDDEPVRPQQQFRINPPYFYDTPDKLDNTTYVGDVPDKL